MATKWDRFTPSQRFWLFVDRRKHEECWPWKGSKSWGGYGLFKVHIPRPKSMNAHRFAYLDTFGPIAEGLHVDHICRNRICVNPNHLRLLTNRENVLIGIGVTAKNAKKTHCKRGHLLEGQNLYIVPKTGYRNCRICRNGGQSSYALQQP